MRRNTSSGSGELFVSDIGDLEEDDDDDGFTFDERFVMFLRLWGIAELTLDSCIAAIFQYHSGETIDPDVPITLERKINFLKSAVAQIPSLRQHEGSALYACELLTADKDLRNTVVHGFPLKVAADHQAHFIMARASRTGLTYHLRVVRLKDWERLETTSVVVQAALGALATALSPPSNMDFDESEEGVRKWISHGITTFPASKRVRDLLKEVLAGRAAD